MISVRARDKHRWAIPRQVNFLIDENVLTGKGANSTISYVHYFFEHHGLGETHAQIHADNCGAQNKNSAFLWYYLWRVNNDLHRIINYDFLLPGHTKFAPEWCFGLVKQKTRRTFISSLFDISNLLQLTLPSLSAYTTEQFVSLHLIGSLTWDNSTRNYRTLNHIIIFDLTMSFQELYFAVSRNCILQAILVLGRKGH